MFDHIYKTIFTGLITVLISSIMLCVDMHSSVAYALLYIGFFLIGAGMLLGFFKTVSESKE